MEEYELDAREKLLEAAEKVGRERFAEILDKNTVGLPWLDSKTGKFEIWPEEEMGFQYSHEYGEWLTDTTRKLLNGEKEVEAYGKPFEAVTRGMGAQEAARELKFALESEIVSAVDDCNLANRDYDLELSMEKIAEAIKREAGGYEIDTATDRYDVLQALDELGLTEWKMPELSEIELAVDITLGDMEVGLRPDELQDYLAGGLTEEDIDLDELESTPAVQLARQMGVSMDELKSPAEGSLAESLREEIDEATGSDWDFDVGVAGSVTAEQYVGLMHGDESCALAVMPGVREQQTPVVGLFNGYTGCGGLMDVKLDKPLKIAPMDVAPGAIGAALETTRVKLVDASRQSALDDYSIGSVFGFDKDIYERSLLPEAEAEVKCALESIGHEEAKGWNLDTAMRDETAQRTFRVGGVDMVLGVSPFSADGATLSGFDMGVGPADNEQGWNDRYGEGHTIAVQNTREANVARAVSSPLAVKAASETVQKASASVRAELADDREGLDTIYEEKRREAHDLAGHGPDGGPGGGIGEYRDSMKDAADKAER